ncbi:MAG: SusE domain-containing protein [Chitinophagaceae bacterium]|nr:SusE domain-containing protein [Chitinophagaceae bacterium]
MKRFNKIKLFALLLAASWFAACDKKADLPFFENGKVPELSSSSATVAPAPADSNNVALTLNWTSPKYATDSAKVKYIIEIDSSGRNFAKAVSYEITGKLTKAFLAKELNAILLGYDFKFNVAYDMDVRLTSSYANNNEQYKSNVLKIKMTPYKVPPKIALPSSNKLYIVGDATDGGWNNPVPVPTQELTRIDETTFGGIFNLTGGKQYLILPVNGDWSFKYSVANNSVAGLAAGGDFGANLNDNFPGPASSGLYKILLDFQTGKFAVTPFTQQHGLPGALFIVGDATPGGWNNPVPLPSQQFTRLNSTRYQLNLALTAGKKYLFLPENGSWGKKFGAVDGGAAGIKLGGPFKPEGEDMPSPDETATYKIEVDFITNTYKLTKQ